MLALQVGAQRRCGYNLAYGGGWLWFGTANLENEALHGIRVE